MQIKDYKCKCGHNDFFFADKGNQKGIYCTYCGKWVKWADKDEQNLAMKQEPCEDAISRQAVQDYIAKYLSQYMYNDVREAVEVIDEYIGELPSVTPVEKVVEPQERENWNGIHAQITAPKGTFERIFNDAADDNDSDI